MFASLEKERDIVVSCATLRLLWTLLIGSPYVKLPHNLLTSAISTIDTLLQRSIFPSTLWKYGCSEDASLLLSVLSGCLTCGAALCGTKPPVDYLEEFLLSSQRAKRFLQTIIDVASRQECTTAKLEALMVVRGLAQNYPAVKPASELFSLAVESIEFCILNESISDTSVMEKVAQQSILLAGDCLSHVPDLVAWRAFLSLIMRWAISHERPMIRAASVVSLATIVRHEITDHLCKSLLQFVLYESSRSMIMDASSPVRAASCKLMASLFPIIIRERYSFIDICHITCALQSASQDGVLAVRIQAAGALATCADSLEKSFRENNPLDIVEIYESNYYPSIMQLLRVAIVASVQMENERVKPFALHALGVLFSLAASLEDESINCQGCVDYSRTLDVIYTSLSSKTAKVQWAACGAAEIVLKSVLHLDDSKIPEINLRRMVDKLQELECDSENSRSRLLARDALANAGMFQPVDGR